MSKILFALALPLALGLVGCSKNPGVPGDAQKAADVLSGDAAGGAGDNPICKMFTVAEIAAYEGVPVEAGINAAMGSGCQWMDTKGDGYVLLQVLPEDYFQVRSRSAGFKDLPDVGKEGFVVPEMAGLGGWAGGAIWPPKA